MNIPTCPGCARVMTLHGKTSAGKTRWRCRACRVSEVGRIDASAKHLQEFLRWLLSRARQVDMAGQGRSFRRRTSRFWQVWPLPPVVDEVCSVVFVDGIYLGRKAVVLIARSEKYVLGWYVARSENSRAWAALLDRIAAPDVVICDGGSGLEKARRVVWPTTQVQRCTFHAFNLITRGTTRAPRLPAGKQLYQLSKELLKVQNQDQAITWMQAYHTWQHTYRDFLNERTWIDDRQVFTHDRLRRAWKGLEMVCVKFGKH